MDTLTLGCSDFEYQSRYSMGVDLGQSHDPTAICVIERVVGWRKVTWTQAPSQFFRPIYLARHLERLPLNMSYTQQVASVAALLRRSPLAERNPAIFIDYTGVGRPVFDLFKQQGLHSVQGVTITAGRNSERTAAGWSVPKTELVSTVQAKLHSGDLRISKSLAEATTLIRELQDFRARVSGLGNASFGAREGAHDDLVLALSIAIFGAEKYGADKTIVGRLTK